MAERIRIAVVTRNHNSSRDRSAQVPLTSLLSTSLQSSLLDRQPTVYALALTHACNFHKSLTLPSPTISVSLKEPLEASGGADAAAAAASAPLAALAEAATVVPSKRNGSGKVKKLPAVALAEAPGPSPPVEGADLVPFADTLDLLKCSLFTCHSELAHTASSDAGTSPSAIDGAAWSVPPHVLLSYRVGTLLHVLTLLTLRCAPVATALAMHEPESKLLALLMHEIPDTAAAGVPSILPLTAQAARLLIALALRSNDAARAIAAAAVADVTAAAAVQPRPPQQQRRAQFAAHVLRALTAHSCGNGRGPMAAVQEASKLLMRIVHDAGACVQLPQLLRPPPPPRAADDAVDFAPGVLAASVLATLRSLTACSQLLSSSMPPVPPGGAPAAAGPIAEAMAAALTAIEEEDAVLLAIEGPYSGPVAEVPAPAPAAETGRVWQGAGGGALWPEVVDLEFEEHQNMVHEMMDAIDHEDAAGMHVDAAAVDVDLDGGDMHADEAEDYMAAHPGGHEDEEDEEEEEEEEEEEDEDVDTELDEDDDGDEHMHEWHDVSMHAMEREPDPVGAVLPPRLPPGYPPGPPTPANAIPPTRMFRNDAEEVDVGTGGDEQREDRRGGGSGAGTADGAAANARIDARLAAGDGQDASERQGDLGTFRLNPRLLDNVLHLHGGAADEAGGDRNTEEGRLQADEAAEFVGVDDDLLATATDLGSVPPSNGIYAHHFFGNDNDVPGAAPFEMEGTVLNLSSES
jgi:hypothetical protein